MSRSGIRRASVLVGAFALVATVASALPSQARGSAPPDGRITAVLQPPYTYYTADVTDPDGDPLTFDWSGTSIGCGSWETPTEAAQDSADWYHGGDPGTLANNTGVPCGHEGGTTSSNHAGTFWVTVHDGNPANSISCKFVGPSGPEHGVIKEGPACEPTSYDLAIEAIPRANEVPQGQGGVLFDFTVNNAGPHPATGVRVQTAWDVVEVGTLTPGGSKLDLLSHDVLFRDMASNRLGIHGLTFEVSPDRPSELNPADNRVHVNWTTVPAGCTRRAGMPLLALNPSSEDANVKNKARAEVVCTKGGDDRITAGNGDVVYSKAGRDKVTCKEAACVLELGGGNDVVSCAAACYVNGGPGKDNCPEGDLVIRDNCEK